MVHREIRDAGPKGSEEEEWLKRESRNGVAFNWLSGTGTGDSGMDVDDAQGGNGPTKGYKFDFSLPLLLLPPCRSH